MLTNIPVNEKAAPLISILENTGLYDDFIEYPVRLRELNALLTLRKTLVERNIDVAVHLVPRRSLVESMRDYLFLRSCGIRRVIGVPFRTKDRRVLFNRKASRYEWEAERLARRLRPIGEVELKNSEWWDLRFTSEEMRKAEVTLLQHHVDKPVIAFSLGTKWDSNDWGTANWENVIAALSNKLSPKFALVALGARGEAERSEKVMQLWRGQSANLCGTTSVRESAAILAGAKLFIGHDSGPMHLAGAAGTPCVAIFSARGLLGQWFPRGEQNIIIYNLTACQGCGLDVCVIHKKKCIMTIPVSEVVDSVMSVLKK